MFIYLLRFIWSYILIYSPLSRIRNSFWSRNLFSVLMILSLIHHRVKASLNRCSLKHCTNPSANRRYWRLDFQFHLNQAPPSTTLSWHTERTNGAITASISLTRMSRPMGYHVGCSDGLYMCSFPRMLLPSPFSGNHDILPSQTTAEQLVFPLTRCMTVYQT